MATTTTIPSESRLVEVAKQQAAYLDYLEKLDEGRKLVYVARNRSLEGEEFRPTYWWEWNGWIKEGDPLAYRSILTNELVFDADYRQRPLAVRYTSMLLDGLDDLGIPNYLCDSGGKGFHDHVFLRLDGIGRVYTYEQIRNLLWRWILEHIPIRGQPGKMGFRNHKFDPVLASWNDQSRGRLVRVIGGKKQRYKTVISEPTVEPDPNLPIVFPRKIKRWRVPHDILDDLDLKWKGPQEGCLRCPVQIPSYYVPVGEYSWYGCARCPRREK